MSFSHSGDFDKILSQVNIKFSQDEGQGRTGPTLRNSLDKGAISLQGGLPQGAAARQNIAG
jgi:hypothetical protein